MRKILVSILLLLSSITLPAQSPQLGWETLYAQLLEQGDEAGQSDEETYDYSQSLPSTRSPSIKPHGRIWNAFPSSPRHKSRN